LFIEYKEINANLTIALSIENIFEKTVNFFKILRLNLKFIIIFIGFTYQAIDSMIGYLKYRTVVNIETGSEYKILPSMSFCVTSKRQLSEINMNKKSFETIVDFLYGCISFGSGYLYEGKYIENEFDNISHVIERVTPFAH
jgi:DNA-binding XRE family transcriptional regulator